MSDLLTTQQLADLLGVTIRTIINYERQGSIPTPITVGRTKRWRREAIDEWIRDREAANVHARSARVKVDGMVETTVDQQLIELRNDLDRIIEATA